MAYSQPGNNHFCAMGPSGFTGHNSPYSVRIQCYNPPFIPSNEVFASGGNSPVGTNSPLHLAERGTISLVNGTGIPQSTIGNGTLMPLDTSVNCIGAFPNRSNCYFNGECASGSCIQGTCAPFQTDFRNNGKTVNRSDVFASAQRGVRRDQNGNGNGSSSSGGTIQFESYEDAKKRMYRVVPVPAQLVPRCQQCYQYAFDSKDVVEPPKNLGPNGNFIRDKMKQCFTYDTELPNGMTSAIAVRWDDPFCRGVYDAVSSKCMDKCSYM
jgi:hypothetical protein